MQYRFDKLHSPKTWSLFCQIIKKKGIVNIGYRPTFGKKKLILEAHIFGLKKNLYGKRIKVMLIKFIRKEKKFKNIIQLKKQIKKDIKKAK